MLLSRSMRVAAGATIAAAGLAAACGGDAGDGQTGPRGTGRLVVQLTDAPFPYDSVRSVDVFVVRIDARQADADSAEAEQGTADAERGRGGWITLAEPKAKFDLLTLRDGKFAALGGEQVPAGEYRAFRLVIDPAQSGVTLKSGGAVDVKWPSAARSGIKIQLAKPVTVDDAATATMLVDFDVEQSFVMRGSAMRNGLLFKPVVKAATR